ncbi:MAG: T9SS type A sorting domain-containing protein [Saprospiraceae bacterium]|nr:T9SS type A sorting domain-containing protein [Saprospiraceae bacterium]
MRRVSREQQIRNEGDISDFGINLSSNDGEKPKPSPLITLSPNPTSDEVVLHIKDVQYHEGTVLMYNMSGQKVAQQKISHGEKLDIRNLNSGQYIIQYNPDNRPGYYLTTNLVKK